MSEAITFANADFRTVNVYDIGHDSELNKNGENPTGIIPEMAKVFGHELSQAPEEANLGGLIALVGPAKTLQDNIAGVRESLGKNKSDDLAIDMARKWIDRSGLLVPVERSYMNPELVITEEDEFSLAVVTGGVRNWIERRAARLSVAIGKVSIGRVLLVGGNRAMKSAEGPGVKDGMTEAEYMETNLKPRFNEAGVSVDVMAVESGVGDEVMRAAASEIDPTSKILVASNAGAWVQNAGQFRRAAIQENPDFDANGEQLYVLSDSFPLGITGKEPTKTHQNPLSALGQILRNGQEIIRHQ